VDSLAAALSYLSKDLSATIIQALSKIDSKKAAQVLFRMGGVEGILQRIKDEEANLRKKLNELAKEKRKAISMDIFRQTLKDYFLSMNSYEIADLLVKLNLTIDEVISTLDVLDPEKRTEVLEVLQRNYPEIFRKLVEKGVGS